MFEDRLDALDVSLLGHTVSQMWEADKRSLLALHAAVADRLGRFEYLEIGSYKGGSLQALIADSRCTRIVSIDPRPDWQPDDRFAEEGYDYPGNSTQEMLDLLAAVPGADMSKLETIELGTDQIDPAGIERLDVCFIDGEHTHAAALRDARFCREVLRGRGIVAFHDFGIVPRAVLEFLRESPQARGYLLRHEIFVVELGVPTLLDDPRIEQQLRLPGWVWRPMTALGGLRLLVWARRLRSGLRERGSRVG